MNNKVFRKRLADDFYKCVQVERSEIFGENDPIPLKQQDDARVMFAGLVTGGYVPGEGIVIMAINPAGGGDNDTRIPSDHELYKSMHEFKEAAVGEILDKFEALNKAALESEQSWGGLTKYINAVLEATDRKNNHVYMNAVPYRVRGDKASDIPRDAFSKAYDKIVSNQLEALKPRAIIVLGKTTDKVLGRYYRDKAPAYYVIPGTRGWTFITDEAKEAIEGIDLNIEGVFKPGEDRKSESIEVNSPKEYVMEKNNDLGLKRTCGYEGLLKDHLKKIGDRKMTELVKGAINGALDLSNSIRIEANTQWIKLMMPSYEFGIGPIVDGFNLAFRSRNIDLGSLAPYRSSRGEGEQWVYVRIKQEAQVTVEDIMDIVKKVNKLSADVKKVVDDEEME